MLTKSAVAGFAVVTLIIGVLLLAPAGDTFAEDPSIYLDIGEVAGYPGQLISIPVYIQTLVDSLDGFEIAISVSRSDLIYFEVDTVVIGVDTSYVCQFDTAGTLASGWQVVRARSEEGKGWNQKLIGISDLGTGDVPGVPDYTSGVLVRFYARIMGDIPDTLSDRTVNLMVSICRFSNQNGLLITPTQCDDGSVSVLIGVLGDVDCSGTINPVDVVYLVNYVYKGWVAGCTEALGDVDCSGTVNPVDVVYLVNYAYKGWAFPC